ncbi:hypothetical protein M378DRAFT_18566 [Amanita muscaria Koide BX008]|uniref:Uncharacterized protein n=1 Tax=Amanita muscaria (strain Koide BX008) TaxID=946122 RepID=A0A0C2WDT9_AMAMK|nr:hypothetical protein M378DRAFT_18566 [Amanita muscaria Koide BX008]
MILFRSEDALFRTKAADSHRRFWNVCLHVQLPSDLGRQRANRNAKHLHTPEEQLNSRSSSAETDGPQQACGYLGHWVGYCSLPTID